MFYYPNVLNHRTGCFATIWLAATKGRNITRRNLLSVNVQRTCLDIVDYVLVRVAALAPGLPRPRFSLYLSSQLQYGVVLIFHKQCQLLLEDVQEAIEKMHRRRSLTQIDMLPDETRQTHLLPDALNLLNESEGASEPFFGTMEFGLPSPSELIRLAQQMEVVPPEHSPSLRGVSPFYDGITASQEAITLTERELTTMPEPEFEGDELQEVDLIDILLEQPDHFPEGEVEREREADEERQRERKRVGEREKERKREGEEDIEREIERAAAEIEQTREMTGSTISMEPAQVTEVSGRDVLFPSEEDLRLPTEMAELDERARTPLPELLPILPAMPSLEEERQKRRRASLQPELVPYSPEAPLEPQRRRRRRRQLVFTDEETQISQEELQAQINNTKTETKLLHEVLVKAPSQESSPATLLSRPCMRFPPEILELWKQNAVIRPLLLLQAVPERERAGDELHEAVPAEELVSKETPRKMVESGISQYDTPVEELLLSTPLPLSSLGTLETTDRDTLPLEIPEAQRSPDPITTSGLEDIPEERVPEPQAVDIEDVLGRLLVTDELEVTFHSLLPPVVSRRTVALAFWSLLEQIEEKEVTVRQDKPYGDILIALMQRPPPV